MLLQPRTGMLTLSTNKTRITIEKAGVYHVHGVFEARTFAKSVVGGLGVGDDSGGVGDGVRDVKDGSTGSSARVKMFKAFGVVLFKNGNGVTVNNAVSGGQYSSVSIDYTCVCQSGDTFRIWINGNMCRSYPSNTLTIQRLG